jgi:hypothetical protein
MIFEGEGMRFERYPIWMRHPDRASLLANNADEEKEYAALGYLPNGVSDGEAFLRACAGDDPPAHYKHHEYPRWMYQADEAGEIAVMVDGAIVKVRGVIVSDNAAQDCLAGSWFTTPAQAAQFVEAGEHNAATASETEAHLLAVEPAADLAREYGANRTLISQRNTTEKAFANQAVETERALSFLNESEQVAARNGADDGKRRLSRPPQGGNQRIAFDALAEPLRQSGDFGKADAPPNRRCLEMKAAVAIVVGYLTCEPKRRNERARQAITGLVARGVFEAKDGWLWSK